MPFLFFFFLFIPLHTKYDSEEEDMLIVWRKKNQILVIQKISSEDINDEGFSHFLSKNRPICSVTLASFTECRTKSLPDIIPSAHFCIGGLMSLPCFFCNVDIIPPAHFYKWTESLL